MRIGLAVALVLTALPATADARTLKLSPMGTIRAVADGGRYVVTRKDFSPGALLRVRDERTGARRTIDSTGCGEPVVGGRWLVMGCPTAEPPYHPQPRVWDLAHPERAAVDVPAQLPLGVVPMFSFTGIGRRWISVDIGEYHQPTRHGRIERTTGRFVEGRPPGCAPRGRITSRGLFLRRCGSRRARRLSRCFWGDCSEPVIAGGAVAWYENERVRAVVLRTGRRRAWRVPANADLRYVTIALSHRHVFVNGGWRGTLPGR